jgi:DNA repair protein RecO (recombination protein O)
MSGSTSSFRIVVLHTIKYKENGIIVQCYSERGGRESFFMKYSAKSKSRINISSLHPLAILEIQLSSHKMGSIDTIKEVVPVIKLTSLRSDIVKSSIALFISELIYKSVREVEANSALYTFLSESIDMLNRIEKGVANFHPWFTVNFCRHAGYSPDIKREPSGELFDIVSARYVSKEGPETICLDNTDTALLYSFFITPPEKLETIKITGKRRYTFTSQIIKYLGFHSGTDLKIESLDVLHEVFE